MPRRLVLLLAAIAHAGPALAACGPAAVDFTAPVPLKAVPVSVGLGGDRVLLGRQGERIAARNQPVWVDETGDPLPRTWMDKVDWSAYRLDNVSRAPARLYFDGDGRLCRAESYELPRRGDGPPFLSGGYTLEYDGAGALTRVVEYEQTAVRRPATYEASGQACLKRDARGALTAFTNEACEDKQQPAAGRFYARDAAGRLLRAIDIAAQGGAFQVQTYDAQGKPDQRYVRRHSPGDGARSYAHVAHASPDSRPYPVHREELNQLSTEVPGNDWRIVSIADDVPLDDTDMQSWNPDTQTILAQGVTDAQGRALLAADAQARVWQAMRDKPGRIFWYSDLMSRVLLLPAMDEARWRACADPANQAADACN
ncbi:hypothetical protein DXK93_04905 [Achromobacter sp. K91]|uniref:hypothetical protein n=1 Tax=Achromobacter sp. K91 TaxID=2292262 RepID=UPI000E675A67|nr:hypothetical protein [Achromobacter sp. K91]RIJ05256.1 hypothetical protein DXK93_04905 [Achromobacter sp. K91]